MAFYIVNWERLPDVKYTINHKAGTNPAPVGGQHVHRDQETDDLIVNNKAWIGGTDIRGRLPTDKYPGDEHYADDRGVRPWRNSGHEPK